MADGDTLGILDEIEALVSDKLQVISYKWLSRNFLVSSNAAKRLLQDFVETHGGGWEVVYSLSGWLKNNPSVYHVRLVSGPKLTEAKEDFDCNCSVQVYSVQPSIPKDAAALWNFEFIQAEELYREPATVNNCLRDNRFCGISNSFVKRSTDGAPVNFRGLKPHNAGKKVAPEDLVQQAGAISKPQPGKAQQSSTKAGFLNVEANMKNKNSRKELNDPASTPLVDKGKGSSVALTKEKVPDTKNSSRNGGSLSNLWDRASAKSKPSVAAAETANVIQNSFASAEAQICAQEAAEGANSDDDDQDVHFRRASNGDGNRKRRVIFDFSDEEEYFDGAVNLSSPDLPKQHSRTESKKNVDTLVPAKIDSDLHDHKEDRPKVKVEKATDIKPDQPSKKDSPVEKRKKTEAVHLENVQKCHLQKDANQKENVIDAVPSAHQRRKVLKTRIDERGREVTEVLWESHEPEVKKTDANMMNKADDSAINGAANNYRPPAAKKSPAVGSPAVSNPAGKAGNKRAGNAKDPKQGNIMSFFKKG